MSFSWKKLFSWGKVKETPPEKLTEQLPIDHEAVEYNGKVHQYEYKGVAKEVSLNLIAQQKS